jgi:hypothetical protein
MLLRLAGVLLLFVASCGSSDGTSGPGIDPNAPNDCNALISQLCAEVVTCGGAATNADCVAAVKTSLNCAAAVGVSSNYSTCLSDLNNTTCAVLLANNTINTPASCQGVILTSS